MEDELELMYIHSKQIWLKVFALGIALIQSKCLKVSVYQYGRVAWWHREFSGIERANFRIKNGVCSKLCDPILANRSLGMYHSEFLVPG